MNDARNALLAKARKALWIARTKREAIYGYSWERDAAIVEHLNREQDAYVALAMRYRAEARAV